MPSRRSSRWCGQFSTSLACFKFPVCHLFASAIRIAWGSDAARVEAGTASCLAGGTHYPPTQPRRLVPLRGAVPVFPIPEVTPRIPRRCDGTPSTFGGRATSICCSRRARRGLRASGRRVCLSISSVRPRLGAVPQGEVRRSNRVDDRGSGACNGAEPSPHYGDGAVPAGSARPSARDPRGGNSLL
jgi:hypothetical protein